MNTYFQNSLYLLGETRQKLPRIFFLFILISILDLIGIGIIGPFLGVVFGGAENLQKQVGSILSINEYSHTELVVILASLLI